MAYRANAARPARAVPVSSHAHAKSDTNVNKSAKVVSTQNWLGSSHPALISHPSGYTIPIRV
jgi:hypothetical protein